ncbi:hypothetical protein H7J51_02375 [Mycobacterium crocinum]|uniref:Uncharacterized protein n=1 Tax=Mycolicibacterium crocinum TaxID=388459 RepID=A0ABY3TJA4_9MYCO|nr:hypothetical protein [Mycolicibacterium crocinum]MCV7214128.1 hypothetical protein [Mycolicibacterium crocinum]ULN39328.1 hypothetical protein MI149_16320 [Mycolicibacterium crocinum]
MGLDPEQRQQRQVTNEAAEEAAAHSNWTYPWPPDGDGAAHPAADGDAGSPIAGGDRSTVDPSIRTSGAGQPDQPAGQPSLWTRAVVAAAIAGCAVLLWKRRLRVRRRRDLTQYGGS